jgi:hypothetical protein
MAYANIAEINVCLADCLQYCEQNPGAEYCVQYVPQLRRVIADLRQTKLSSDHYYSRWRLEVGDDKRSWKTVATLLREVQVRLKKVDAIGFPDRRVMYWDVPLLEVAARDMMDYLRDRSDDIDFAADYLTRFEQAIATAHGEDDQSEDALHSYRNHIGARRDAVSDATHVITGLRTAMRKELGKDSPEYKSIRWTWALAPDEPVL